MANIFKLRREKNDTSTGSLLGWKSTSVKPEGEITQKPWLKPEHVFEVAAGHLYIAYSKK